MTVDKEQSSETRCLRCGEMTAGRFCAGCGAPLRDVSCEACGEALVPGARFCNNCGAPVAASKAGATTAASHSEGGMAKWIAAAAVLVLVAFVAGEAAGRRSLPDAGPVEQAGSAPLAGTATAPDISTMSPEERASRLFNRVMSYTEQGKTDSARFFAPMAIQAYEMMGPLDAHARYDIGDISAAIGDASPARAQADTILAAEPNHLLGLVLAIRGAELAGDAPAATRFRRRLVTAAPSERAKDVKEYVEHARDIDNALKKAGAP